MVSTSTLVGAAMFAFAAAAYYLLAADDFTSIQEGDAIVVTGSHTGIGKHAALSLAREGFVVFACVRNPKHGDELLQEAQAATQKDGIDYSTKIRPLLLDVTQPEQIEQAVETVSQFVGEKGLYGLFNNAGVGVDRSVGEPFGSSVEGVPLEQTRRMFEVNYFGLLQVTKAFLPLLRKRRGSRIVSNTSIAGFFAGAFVSSYSASKFAVEALSDSLRRELDPHGVFVSVLEPGFIRTPILEQFQQSLDASAATIQDNVYAKQEIRHWKQAIQNSATLAASPRVTSAAVIHAMRATRPKTRYRVGGLSGIAWFLSLLPDKWTDAILRANRNVDVTDDQLKDSIEKHRQHNTQFEL